eukprot:TRINITY_DN8829_c0_g1_i1.p1 TRINITY_DN8829_c0_g1~~TRINITY_DN8829_c0_g1_i1.p1  ORF type:complete len:165 (-),score=23.73 TRINITY_DN8829_c0_g1_i1:60-554(-)
MQSGIGNTSVKGFIIVYIIAYLCCNVPINIAGLVIASTKYNSCVSSTTLTADNGLPLWIIVFCAVGLGSIFINIPLIILSFKCFKSFLPIMIFFVISSLFTLSWFIYGGVVLFTDNGSGYACRDSLNGEGFQVWQVGLAVWIIALVGGCGQLSTRRIADSRSNR